MRDLDLRLAQAKKRLGLKPGDVFESCSWHPVLCLGVDYKSDEIWGISLMDGTYPRSCSLIHCGVRKLSLREAWRIRIAGPTDLDARKRIKSEDRWWNANTEKETLRVSNIGPRVPKK